MIDTVEELVRVLQRSQRRLVLAESCTAGLVAASIAHVPGVSEWFCGSAVTYQSETKVAWLGVDPEAIAKETAVSGTVAAQMAAGVLSETPQADIAASITGHFGPSAPAGFDGVIFIAVTDRAQPNPRVSRHHLRTQTRIERQREAATLVVDQLLKFLQA